MGLQEIREILFVYFDSLLSIPRNESDLSILINAQVDRGQIYPFLVGMAMGKVLVG